MTRRIEFEPQRADDKALVKRIGELVQARQATEVALSEAVAEYSRRRISLARAGKQIEGPLAEPIAPTEGFQLDLACRERLAADHFQADQEARRNPLTAGLFR